MKDSRKCIGADISSANLKFADGSQWARSCAFPMWKNPDRLAAAIVSELKDVSDIQTLAITMTGEMADCFSDRTAGVQHIIEHTERAADELNVQELVYYGVDGLFRTASESTTAANLLASANWHALASFVGLEIAADALLIDIGSTTTDIIPIRHGVVDCSDRTDHDRLCSGSLVYVGCRRTPVCALVKHLPLDHRSVSVMNEVFATIDDAMLILSLVPEATQETDTADGRPRTVAFAINRLARMIGLDGQQVSITQAAAMASVVVDAATRMISENVTNSRGDVPIVVSGHGGTLLKSTGGVNVIDLDQHLNPNASRCAPAFAVARLTLARQDSLSPQPV